MQSIVVNVTNHLDRIEGVEALLQKEMLVVTNWKDKGILEHLFIKDDRTGAILVFKNVTAPEVKELMATLPFSPYIENTEYTLAEKAW
jgi:hypothetical protein